MKPSDNYTVSDETLRTRINLMHTMLDIIELCLDDQTDLAKAVVQKTSDNVLILAEEMQEGVDQR